MRSVHAGAVQTHFFHFYFFCEKQPPNDFKKLRKIDTNPWKNDAGIARSRFLRGLEKRWFFSEVRDGLAIIIPDPGAQPTAPHFAKKDTNYSKWGASGGIGSIGIKESRHQGIKESGNQCIQESRKQGIRESRNQWIKESRNQGIKESGNHGSKEATNIRSLESQKQRILEALNLRKKS